MTSRQKRSPRKISWALVGLGAQGERLAHALASSSTGTLLAVIANDMTRAKEFANKFGIPHYYNSLKNAFSDKRTNFDSVCIATRNDMHAKDVLLALRMGKDVFCEKPLTLTIGEGTAIIRTLTHSALRCDVDFQLRQDPSVIEAKKIIGAGVLGPLLYIDMLWAIGVFGEATLPSLPRHMQWRENREQAGGGALVARGVHLFDLLRFLTGEEVIQVIAHTDAGVRSVDKTAAGILTTQKGIVAIISTSKMMPAAQNHIAIYGRDAALFIDPFNKQKSSLIFISKTKKYAKDFPVINLYTAAFDSFANPSSQHPNANAFDGVQATAILEAYKKSSSAKRAVRVAHAPRDSK